MVIIKADSFNQRFVYVFHPDSCRFSGIACYWISEETTVGGTQQMGHRALQNLVGRAIVDRDFREQLLNGSRKQTIAEFDLTEDEVKAVEAIEAHSLEEFAGRLHGWIEAAESEH